jgi:hypothetical protein
MKTFKVSLSRAYNIIIDAKNEKCAKELTEFFIGDPVDKSNKKERKGSNC